MRTTRALAVIGAFIVAGASVTAESGDWMQRPEIQEVRAVVHEIDAGLEESRFTTRTREFEYCYPSDTSRSLYSDAGGLHPLYVVEGGSGDSARTVKYYYDARRVLRFGFASIRAVNGTHLEIRVYFDRSGKEIYQDWRHIAGPGWATSFGEFVADPLVDFESGGTCPEKAP